MKTSRFAKFFAVSAMLALLGMLGGCDGGSGSAPVDAPPIAAITAQPADQSAVAGATATFTVVATGATAYQWQSSSDGGTSFVNLSLATSANHTTPITALSDSGKRFRVMVSGAANTVTSSAATLTVTPAVVEPSISMQPTAQTVTAGQSASFSVTAAGTAITYQWQRSTDAGANFANIVGANNATLTLAAVAQGDNAQQFRVVVSNGAGSITSSAALLTVNPAQAVPAFTTQPASVTVVAPNAASFTATASGVPAPTLQWQVSSNAGAAFANIAGTTGNSYTTPATNTGDNGKQYRVVATNAAGASTSAVATLTVNAATVAPLFTTQPVSVTISAGQSTQFTVAASGTPTPNLQWQLSTDNGANFSNIVGETGTVFNVINAAQGNNGRQFRAVASNSAGTVNSNAATLTVLAPDLRMLAARVNHTATLIGGGKVLAVGGVVNSSSGGFFSSTETFDPATTTWSASASLSVARGFHTATLLSNGKVLVVGGLGVNPGAPPIRLASVELYDPATNSWSVAASLVVARSGHTATLLPNGKVLVAGGSTNIANQLTAIAELYDPVSNSWSAAGSLLVVRQYHQATLLPNGRVLLAGGNNNFIGSLASTELYDPSTNSWSAGASLARARSQLSLTSLSDGRVLAVGGFDQQGIGTVASAEVYDAVNNTWSAAGSLATGRYDHTATLLANGQVLIAAGFASSYLASAELYDPATNGWTATGSLAVARYMHVATRLTSGEVLVTGGNGLTNNAPVARAELYGPSSGTWR